MLRELGGAGQRRLLASHAVVTGAGGIGSPALLYLAAAGVGRLTIIDDDSVSLANLQRQIVFDTAAIGTPKVDAAATRLTAMNPDVDIRAVAARIDAANVAGLIAGADVVIDGTDSFKSRLVIADAAYAARIPLVSAAVAQFQAQVATFRGWEAERPCYRCFVGDAHDADDCDSCAEQGVLGAMAGIAGSFAALEALRQLAGFGEDAAGKLHIFDGLKPAMRTLTLPSDPGCSTCGRTETAQGGE